MASSDSDEFESADELNPAEGSDSRPRRRSKKTSSNYDSEDGTPAKSKEPVICKDISSHPTQLTEAPTDGWGDFDVEDETDKSIEPSASDHSEIKLERTKKQCELPTIEKELRVKKKSPNKQLTEEAGDGWDQFDDWGEDSVADDKQTPQQERHQQPPKQATPEEDKIKSVADRLATLSPKDSAGGGSAWGWGWGVDSLLNTASAGISTLTSTVSQGISTVSNALETGIGAPEPEELARRLKTSEAETASDQGPTDSPEDPGYTSKSTSDDSGFALGSLMTGVSHITKFVENTGTKVITGGLDTLETIGKKTMQVLQDGDPRLAKKRAMLGLDGADKPVLSQVLREAKSRADEEDRLREQKKEAKEVHYETLFDDFEGLVHLEALEMLSRQVGMRLEERLRAAPPDKKKDMLETMQQVAELCEITDSDDEIDDVTTDRELTEPETLYNRLREATQDSGLQLHLQPLVKLYEDILSFLSSEECVNERAVYKRGISSLAHTTALCVELYHKAAELLLVKSRRSTADETDALAQMTSVLTRHVSDLANDFTRKLNDMSNDANKEQVSGYITNVFLEAGNSSTYIQDAFQLTLPILQIGAA